MPADLLVAAAVLAGLFAALWWGWGRKPPPDEPHQ